MTNELDTVAVVFVWSSSMKKDLRECYCVPDQYLFASVLLPKVHRSFCHKHRTVLQLVKINRLYFLALFVAPVKWSAAIRPHESMPDSLMGLFSCVRLSSAHSIRWVYEFAVIQSIALAAVYPFPISVVQEVSTIVSNHY